MAPNLDLLAGGVLDWLAAVAAAAAAEEEDLPDYVSEEEVSEREVSSPLFWPPDEEDEEEQDEDWDWDEADSGYGSLSEEEDEEDVEEEGEEDDQVLLPEEFWHGVRQGAPPAQARDPVGRPPTPDPQPRAESPSPAFRIFEELLHSWERPLSHPAPAAPPPPAPAPPGPGPAPAFLALGGFKRVRDEEEEEDPSSKRPRFSYFEDSPDEPTPSTSAGTSGFSRYFQRPHLLRDPDDSDDND